MLAFLFASGMAASSSSSSASAAAAAAAASEPEPIANAELETLWSSVTKAAHGGTKRSSDGMLGLPAGAASFDIPELQDYKKGRILPENGTYVAPGEDPTEGGRFGPQYRQEMWTRQRILEQNPDYQFIFILSGLTNAPVERLYNEDSLDRSFRMRLAQSQTQLRVQEVQQTRDSLQRDLTREQGAQISAVALRGRLNERRRADGILALLPAHVQAVRRYILEQEDNFYRLAVGSTLELGVGQLVSVPAREEAVLERAIVQLLGGPNSAEDEPDIGTSVQVTTDILVRFAFGDSNTGALRLAEVASSATVRSALITAYRLAFPGKTPIFYDGQTSLTDGPRSPDAPLALREAVQRLLALHVLAKVNDLTTERDRMLASLVAQFSMDSGRAVSQAARLTTQTFVPRARELSRDQALPSWISELRAVASVLRTALDLHDAESQMAAPRSAEQPVRTISEIAQAAGAEMRTRATLAGATVAAAEASARTEIARVLANPPNHLFAVPQSERDAARVTLTEVDRRLAAVPSSVEREDTFATLTALGVLGSPSLEADLSLRQAVSATERRQLSTPVSDDRTWTNAMSWYEQLGGTLFAERDAWSVDDDDSATVVTAGVEFPASSASRKTDDIPLWGPTSSPPPAISTQARALWEQHVPVLRTALAKIAAASARASTAENATGTATNRNAREGALPEELRPDSAPPQLTTNEILVFRTMTGGYAPEEAERFPEAFPKTRWPLFVFMSRLLETELAFADASIEQTITTREALLDSIRQRIQAILRGIPQPAAVVEPPYQHRRSYVEQPVNSGIVSLKPIVTASIEKAWGQLNRLAPHITRAVHNDVEVIQHTPGVRTDFAELVAVNMSIAAQQFPTRYKQLGERVYTALDMNNLIHRFRFTIKIDNVPLPRRHTGSGAGAGAGAGASVRTPVARVTIRPVSEYVQEPRRSGPFLL